MFRVPNIEFFFESDEQSGSKLNFDKRRKREGPALQNTEYSFRLYNVVGVSWLSRQI